MYGIVMRQDFGSQLQSQIGACTLGVSISTRSILCTEDKKSVVTTFAESLPVLLEC